jgi:hypothetical protein
MRLLLLSLVLLSAFAARGMEEDGLAAGEEYTGHTEEEVDEARDEFAAIDLNGDGQITVDEIRAMQEVPHTRASLPWAIPRRLKAPRAEFASCAPPLRRRYVGVGAHSTECVGGLPIASAALWSRAPARGRCQRGSRSLYRLLYESALRSQQRAGRVKPSLPLALCPFTLGRF